MNVSKDIDSDPFAVAITVAVGVGLKLHSVTLRRTSSMLVAGD